MLDLAGRRVLVLGLGLSGTSAARFCAERGASVVAADERDDVAWLEAAALPGVELATGRPFPDPADFDLVVPSPGVPPARYRDRAPLVWGDVELAAQALSIPIVAVTGTNGKSTVTRMLEAMLRAAGLRARAAGNIGDPVLALVGEPLDVAVLEVSSFQLETIESFRPRVAVILNLTPDHLDRHGSFAAYRAAKARIFAQQREDDAAVFSADDPEVRSLAQEARSRRIFFSTRGPVDVGGWLDSGSVVLRGKEGPPLRVSLEGLRLSGAHNRENALAALTAVWALGEDPVAAAGGLTTFTGLAHRMEPVARIDGVSWIDDSKATNPGAAERALASCSGPVVWIAGGRDKGLDFAGLADAAVPRARAAVLLGEAAGKLEEALAGRIPVIAAASLEDAVRSAAHLAQTGDTVILTPACASQDQFRDFAERGERFRSAVEALKGERS